MGAATLVAVSQVGFFKLATQGADPKRPGSVIAQKVPTALPQDIEPSCAPAAASTLMSMADGDAPTVGTMKVLLSQFKDEVAADFRAMLHTCQQSIDELGERTDHLETKMEEVVGSHNDLIVSHETLQAEVMALKDSLKIGLGVTTLKYAGFLKQFQPTACENLQ